MILEHLGAITIAFLLDLLVGDPPTWPHPVKWMGSLIGALEKRLNKGNGRIGKGVGMLVIVLFLVFIPSLLITKAAYYVHPIVGISIEAILIATTIAHKSLRDASLEVYHPLKKEDFPLARKKLSYIVGRDTETLNEQEIVRGTVETVAENTSDGVTAPMFWAFIGGAPLALVYRAINTCDSMVGYKNNRFMDFGWASARMDDIANWIPSRLTGMIMLIANTRLGENNWSILFRDAKKHPSPNSGWCEAAAAALLQVQLGGVNTYKGMISNRALMGDAMVPLDRNHIPEMNRILSKTVLVYLVLLWLGGASIDMAITWF